MRTFRPVSALGLALAPLALFALGTAAASPAHAGGGWGMTLTASLDHLTDPGPRFLAGTPHTVFATLTDDPGEASLRDVRVTIADLDPAEFPVTCDDGVNGHMALEPHQSLHCTAPFKAETGLRTIVVTATAQVPGSGSMSRSKQLHYTGFVAPPPPPAHAAVQKPPAPVSGHGDAAPAPLDPPARPPLVAPPPPLGAAPTADAPGCAGPMHGALTATGSGPLHAALVPAQAAGTCCGTTSSAEADGSATTDTACCDPGGGGPDGGRSGGGGSACCAPVTGGAAADAASACCAPAAGKAAPACCPPATGGAATGKTAACCAAATMAARHAALAATHGTATFCPNAHTPRGAKTGGSWSLPHTGTIAPLLALAALAVLGLGAFLVGTARTRAREDQAS